MKVAESLEWRRIYWVNGLAHHGMAPRGEATYKWLGKQAVQDPPCNGWALALVITGAKRSTIFCPYQLASYGVPVDCAELARSREPAEFRRDFMVELITRNWASSQRLGTPADLDTAAIVLKRLGAEVPKMVLGADGLADTKVRGGKETGSRLLRPVKRAGKRGRFLEWWMRETTTKSVREAMAEFGMTRSNVLSYLFILQKDHGIGYSLVGDAATVALPDDCTNPFDDAAGPEAKDEEWLK